MRWSLSPRPIYFENARLADPVNGETRGSLRLDRGKIAGINVPPARDDQRFDLQGAILLPALVNAHDHLELNNFPRWKNRPCYANAREWAMQANSQLDSDPAIVSARRVPLADRLFIGGMKNLLSGAVTVAHHNPYHAPLRRSAYPIRVVKRYGWSHSLYLSPDFAQTYHRTRRDAPYMIHLAEGTDPEAQGELDRLDAADALHSNTVLIHGVGLTHSQRAAAISRGAGLVWCPSSNLFLLNASASVGDFSNANALAIGSDSRLTGERDLLGELRIAKESNQIPVDALLRAVTSDAAAMLCLRDVGRLAPGNRADLIILPGSYRSAADAPGTISRAELRAVIRDGTVRVADPDFAPLLPGASRATVDNRDKIIPLDLANQYRQSSIQELGFKLL